MGTINHLLEKHQPDISDLDVLIAPHHGRDSDKDFSFLDVMKPKLTLVGNGGVSKRRILFFYKQSPDFHKPGLCHVQKILYL